MPLNAHRLVVKTAKEMANELFEAYARDNATYRKLRADGQVTEKRARRVFVDRVAPKLYEDARKILVQMLGQPEDRVTATMKEEIYDALIKDNILRANRVVAKEAAIIPARLH